LNRNDDQPEPEHAHRIKDDPTDEWLPYIYAELRKLAKVRLANEPLGQSLAPTALVHEVYLRLTQNDQQWDSRGHFFASAAIAMQRILIENARRKSQKKRGGDRKRESLGNPPDPCPNDRLVALANALELLAAEDPVAAQVVDLLHFGGLKQTVVASQLGLTIYQTRQKWAYARAWLLNVLTE
jgi:RNA polymerase sigma factor (TIGR02999 family)